MSRILITNPIDIDKPFFEMGHERNNINLLWNDILEYKPQSSVSSQNFSENELKIDKHLMKKGGGGCSQRALGIF